MSKSYSDLCVFAPLREIFRIAARPRLERLERLEWASDLFLKLLARKIRRRHDAAVDQQRMTVDETRIVAD